MPSRFAELLRYHRLNRGFSQEALAEAARISASSIGTYERGIHSAPHRKTITLLADSLQLEGAAREEFEAAGRRTPRSASPRSDDSERRDNLPSQVTSFIGRASEIDRAADLLRRNRIVTLTGSGGIGKTRLALQTASRLKNEFPQGIWFIDFGSIVGPSLVAQRLARALDIPYSGSSDVDDLIAQFAERTQLLIFDTCEHLLAPIAELAAAIVRNRTKTTILATSRERLRITGEAVLRVPTLPVPTTLPETPLDAQSFSAIALFVERTQLVMPDFALTAVYVEDVVSICRRLEGIPLAIELAAARLPSLGLSGLRTKLSDRFAALSIGLRDLVRRQQTLHATIAWSYDLLDKREQSALKALSTFPASFTLVAGVAVCDPMLGESIIVDLISSLAEKSFLAIELVEHRHDRYLMLDSNREYFRRIMSDEELQNARLRFAEWCASFAETCDRVRFTMSLDTWIEMVRPESDSIFVALNWALKDGGQLLIAARIVAGLRAYWVGIGRNEEYARLAGDFLTKISSETYPSLAARLIFSRYNALPTADANQSLLFARGLLEMSDDRLGLMICNLYLGDSLHYDDPVEASRATDEAETLARLLQLPRVLLYVAEVRVDNLMRDGRNVEARDAYIELIRQRRAFGEMAGVRTAMIELSSVEFSLGNITQAAEIASEVVAMATDVDHAGHGTALSVLTLYLTLLGEEEAVKAAARQVLLARSMDVNYIVPRVILATAVVTAREGHCASAARLFGFCKANDPKGQLENNDATKACCDALMTLLRKAFSDIEIETHVRAGETLSQAQAVEEALAL